MTKFRVGVLLLVIAFCCSCHSTTYWVASADNVWYDAYRDYDKACIAGHDHSPPPCFPLAKVFEENEKDLEAAGAALKRGGSIAPQQTRVKESQKKLKKEVKWAKAAPAGTVVPSPAPKLSLSRNEPGSKVEPPKP